MSEPLIHRDNWIEENLKVGRSVASGVSGDGRGEILSYGNWFMRLATPGFTGIGIHGSTNNESSVPGRGSEGCIRLRNNDLDQLKEKYAYVGMKVVILPDETTTN